MRKGIRITSLLVVLTLLLLLSVRWAERNGHLDLRFARIDNSCQLDSALIAEILRPYFGVSLLKLNTDSLKSQFSALDGVDSVFLSIHYPNTLVIALKTGEPAVILSYPDRTVPVTASGAALPVDWGSDSLPMIIIEGYPEDEAISSALNLLIKRNLGNAVSIQVDSEAIAVSDNGIRVIIDYHRTSDNWLTWQTIRTNIAGQTGEVDLRYTGQAVLRFAEGI